MLDLYIDSEGIEADLKPILKLAIKSVIIKFKQADRSITFRPPIIKLTKKQVEAIIERGKDRPWGRRKNYAGAPDDWVREVYGDWIPGLLQSHLRRADMKLYNALQKHIARYGLPDDLNVPNLKSSNRHRKIFSPAPT